jgi:hypothetical protein
VAVEFALLLPLLMLFLFGIIQYGYGLFQLQTFNSALTESSRQASIGILDCASFDDGMKTMAHSDGLDPSELSKPIVEWLDADGNLVNRPELNGMVRVTATYKPFKIGLPFIPFPDSFTKSRTVLVQDLGELTKNCNL